MRIATPGGGGYGVRLSFARLGSLRAAAPLAASLGTALARPGARYTGPMGRTGFIVHPTYRLRGGRAVVQLFGRLSSGEAFLVEDTRFRPYFFTHPEATRLLADERDVEIEPSELVDLAGAPLVRVYAPVPPAVPRLRDKLIAGGAKALEADLRFPYRYLVDKGLRAAVEIVGEPDASDPALLRFRDPELVPGSAHPELRVLSLDLETLPDASRILSVALVGAGADEVHVLSAAPIEGALVHPDEASLVRAFVARVRELDPDVLTGWNVVDFDFDVLIARARSLGIPLELGRAPGPVAIAQDASFTRQRRAEIPGRIVLDGIGLARDAFIQLDDFSLETAAQTLLGRGKRIAKSGRDRGAEIVRMYREDPRAFVAYNREDAVLVQEILAKESLLELAIERSLLCGMQLDRVGASIASFDLLYLPELRQRGRVAPSVDREREATGRVSGGAVMESHPGVFRNVAVFDFKSLYPSLMRTFNLDPLAHAVAGADALVAPNGARFSRTVAILPEVLDPLRRAARAGQAPRRQARRPRDQDHDERDDRRARRAVGPLLRSRGRQRRHRLRPADARAHPAARSKPRARASCTATPTRCSCRSARSSPSKRPTARPSACARACRTSCPRRSAPSGTSSRSSSSSSSTSTSASSSRACAAEPRAARSATRGS